MCIPTNCTMTCDSLDKLIYLPTLLPTATYTLSPSRMLPSNCVCKNLANDLLLCANSETDPTHPTELSVNCCALLMHSFENCARVLTDILTERRFSSCAPTLFLNDIYFNDCCPGCRRRCHRRITNSPDDGYRSEINFCEIKFLCANNA